jgi:hypothetical protein
VQRGSARGRCVSIFLDKKRRCIGKSQSKRPPKRTQRLPRQDVAGDAREREVADHDALVLGQQLANHTGVLSRGGRSLPANDSGCDIHRDSTTSRWSAAGQPHRRGTTKWRRGAAGRRPTTGVERTKLAVLRSRCMIFLECRNAIPFAAPSTYSTCMQAGRQRMCATRRHLASE